MPTEIAEQLGAERTEQEGDRARPRSPSGAPPTSRRVATVVAAAAGYLVLAVFVFWHIWSNHPTTNTLCGCSDTSLFTWFFNWPAYAIAHGLDPFYSTAMAYPRGVNLSLGVGFGIVLAPVTWLFSAITSLNVALTLSPVLSALAMFVLLRRWVSWAPAAFIGGLFYGFSPFVLGSLDNAWVNLGLVALPPLMLVCLDDLFVRRRHRPVVVGLLLGILVALQYVIGSELLVVMAVVGACVAVVVALYTVWRRPGVFGPRIRYAFPGLVVAGVVALVLVAYPVGFALAGPAHFSTDVWPHTGTGLIHALTSQSSTLENFYSPAPQNLGVLSIHQTWGGYQGPVLSVQYFGLGMIVVLVAGLALWRRERRLWLFGSAALIAATLSLGAPNGQLLPWDLIGGLPILDDVTPYRFVFVSYLAVAVMLGLIVDLTYQSVRRRLDGDPAPASTTSSGANRLHGLGAGMVALAVAALALAFPAVYVAQSIPATTRPTYVPTWFERVAPHLTGHQVVLTVPPPFAVESPMTWQVEAGMHYSMIGEGGPAGLILQMPQDEQPGAQVIWGESLSTCGNAPAAVTASDVSNVRHVLRRWGVTMVVLPDQPALPVYDRARCVTRAAALFTAATGRRPVLQDDAWVWSGVQGDEAETLADEGVPPACVAGLPAGGRHAVEEATSCVLAASVPS